SDGNVTMSANRNCTATFNLLPPNTLVVNKSGTGTGTVTSSPAGINCGSTCSATFSAGQVVTLTATPSPGSSFSGWSGDPGCSGGSLIIGTFQSCTANFNSLTPNTLTITKAGQGSGTVTSSPVGINCGSTCSAQFLPNQVVNLTATAQTGSAFAGWS